MGFLKIVSSQKGKTQRTTVVAHGVSKGMYKGKGHEDSEDKHGHEKKAQ